MLLGNYFYTGNVAEQFNAAPLICPGETFIFRCTVTGNMRGVTTWLVNGSIECNLLHRYNFSSICGPSDSFTARPGIGFGTLAISYSSTLSGTATHALNGTLVECFGPANIIEPANRINGSTLEMLGRYCNTQFVAIRLKTGWCMGRSGKFRLLFSMKYSLIPAHLQNCLFNFCSRF